MFISFLYEDYIFLITKLYLLWNIKQDNSRHVTVSLCCVPLILYKLKERWVYNLKNYKALFQLITFILFWIENRRLILTLTRKVREAARNFRESKISNEKSKFFLFYQNIPFCELVSKKIF